MNDSSSSSTGVKAENRLPMARVKTIMKSSPDVELIASESVLIMTRVTELFINYLAENAYKRCKNDKLKMFEYKHLADFVNDEDNLEFLTQIIPKKMTVKEVRELQQTINIDSTDDESAEEEEDDESSSSSESSEEKSVIELSD